MNSGSYWAPWPTMDMSKIHPDLRPFVKDRKTYNIAKRYNPTIDKEKPAYREPVYPSYENYLNGGKTEEQLRLEDAEDRGKAFDRGLWNGANTIGQYGLALVRAGSNVGHSIANKATSGVATAVGSVFPESRFQNVADVMRDRYNAAIESSKANIDSKLQNGARWLNRQNGIVQTYTPYKNPDDPTIKPAERAGFIASMLPVAWGGTKLLGYLSRPAMTTAGKALTGNWTKSKLLNATGKLLAAPLVGYPTTDFFTGASHTAPDSSSRTRAANTMLHNTLPYVGAVAEPGSFGLYTASRFRDIRDPFMEANGMVLANLAPHFVDPNKGLLGSAAESLQQTLGPDALQKLKDVDPARVGAAIGTVLGKTDEGRTKSLETLFFNTRRDPYARFIGAQPAVRNLVTDMIAGRDQAADRDAFLRGLKGTLEDNPYAKGSFIGANNADKYEQSKPLYNQIMQAHRSGKYEDSIDPTIQLMNMWLGEDSTNPEAYGYNQNTIDQAKQKTKEGYEAAKNRDWNTMIQKGVELFNIFKDSAATEARRAVMQGMHPDAGLFNSK